jgi:vacuolar iron transporter family protein
MKDEHGILEHKDGYNWLSDFVYGGIDGAVTTFAVVAGVEGASLSLNIILILGFANLLADGFSMAVGKYSSDKSELEQFNKVRSIEFEHLVSRRDHEITEVREIMGSYGFEGKDLDRAVEIIISDDEVWVDLMMRNEFNMTIEGINPVKGAWWTFLSFISIGFIPLLGYTAMAVFDFQLLEMFWVTAGFTLFALFLVGAVRSKFSMRSWITSGLETMSIGGVAAVIAYVVGAALKGIIA